MSDYKTIKLEVLEEIATVTLSRPQQLNAAPPQMFAEIHQVIERVPELGARALLLTGEGRAFCSGADLATEGEGSIRGGESMRRWIYEVYNPCLLALADLSIPVVTALNGLVAGVGVGLALAGDFVFAARSTYFLQAFVNIGVVPDGGSSWVLPRLVGVQRAKEMMMLGERLPASKAEEWGMIYKCLEDEHLHEEAYRMAKRLAEGPTVALGLMRRLVNQGLGVDYAEGLRNEAEFQYLAGKTEDSDEGFAAFLEKRKTNFKGR